MRLLLNPIGLSLLAAGFVMAMPQLASAQSADSLSDLYACEAISDKEIQLTCFLRETAKLRAAETSGDLVAVEKDEVEDFKAFKAEKEVKAKIEPEAKTKPKAEKKKKTPKSRTLAIRSTSKVGNRIRFTLENGEVWQQIETARVRLGQGNPDTLTIKKAAFGSFLGKVNDKTPSFRVRQVKQD